MPSEKDWKFGTLLERRGTEQIMFIRWDKERTRMMGGGYAWFIGMRLSSTRSSRYGQIPIARSGELANYQANQCKPLVSEDMTDMLEMLDAVEKAI